MQSRLKQESIQVSAEANVLLEGTLALPINAQGIVVFAHGSGSSRYSPRNQFVAQTLNDAGFATLLIDLLTSDEEHIDNHTRHLRFDIDLLARRLVGAIDWLTKQAATRSLNIGLFGASTGAGAALVAAAQRPGLVSAVVSRGGRPDLAGEALTYVQAPTLLIVGERDMPVIALNRQAITQLRVGSRLEIVPGASHLFPEGNTLEMAATLAKRWFTKHLMEA